MTLLPGSDIVPAMNWEGLAFQAVDGLASASGLFFVAAGLSLIFGVTRIINIAYGSLYMLGTYIAVTWATAMDRALGFWGGIVAAALHRRRSRRADRDRTVAPHLRRPGAVSAPCHLCAASRHQRCGAVAVGTRPGPARRHRNSRPPACRATTLS
jgi:hypothetical protein